MSERDKYQKIYADQAKEKGYRKYGHSNHGLPFLEHFLSLQPESVLDVGCGHNEWILVLREHGIMGLGVDFACPGADLIANADKLPFEDKEWDFVTAFDMLEHLLPEQVENVLDELSHISRRFAFSICYRDSSIRCEGETLHPCVRSENWWLKQIAKFGTPRKQGKYIIGEWL